MKVGDCVDLPAACHGINNPVHVLSKCAITSERQIVRDVAGKDMLDVIETRTPLRLFVIEILPIRRGGSGLAAGAVIANRIRKALRIRVVRLEREALGKALLE